MGITTIEEYLHSSDRDSTGYANIISKGFGVCTTGVQRRTVLGQGLFNPLLRNSVKADGIGTLNLPG